MLLNFVELWYDEIMDKDNEYTQKITELKKQLEDVFAQSDNDDFERKKELFDKKTERRKSLVDLYLDKCISKEEFKKMSAELDAEIETLKNELQPCAANALDRNSKDAIIAECIAYANKILTSNEDNDEFIKQILESMTISMDNIITIKLNLLPFKWKFALASVATAAGSFLSRNDQATMYVSDANTEQIVAEVSENDAKNAQRDHTVTDIPMSVSKPLSSG